MLNLTDYYSGKTILITGAAGFIGSSLVNSLNAIDCKIIGLKTGARATEIPSAGKAKIQFHNGDVRSPGIWDDLLEGVDTVFHLAAQTSSHHADENPFEDLKINLLPVVRFVETCQKRGIRPDIIFSGTVTQTGLTTKVPVDESRGDVPLTVYDINKLAAEKYLQYYGRVMDGRSVTLRLANVYGPGPTSGRPDRGILNQMVSNALYGKALTVFGEGNYIRDYVFIDDVVRAFLTAGASISGLNGNFYNIGSGKGHTIKEMAEAVRDAVAKTSGRHININHVPVPSSLSPIEFRHFVANTYRFQTDTGWQPRFSLPDGVTRTIQFFKEL
jgi:nucleoside-diphosphate-sugar epimerase